MSEIERRVIGSVLRDPTLYPRAEVIRYDDLDDPLCRDVWAALRSVSMDGKPVTIDRVTGSCMEATGPEVAALAQAGTLNVDRLADAVTLLIDKKRSRALEQDLSEHLGRLRNGQHWRETIATLGTKLVDDYDGHTARNGNQVRQAVLRELRLGGTARVATGLAQIDRYFDGGLPAGFLIGLGAQTKTGKTTLAATISGNWDEARIPHLVFSLERRDTHIEKLKTGRRLGFNMQQLGDNLAAVESEAFRSATYYIHNTQLTVEEWRHEVLHHVRRYGVRAVLVDYFQLFVSSARLGRKETREQELNRTVQLIANTAVDANVPIVLFSQNNDAGEPRDCKAIKQAAGYYGNIHRDQGQDGTWIETIATSISPFVNIGSFTQPAMVLDIGPGPHFRDE